MNEKLIVRLFFFIGLAFTVACAIISVFAHDGFIVIAFFTGMLGVSSMLVGIVKFFEDRRFGSATSNKPKRKEIKIKTARSKPKTKQAKVRNAKRARNKSKHEPKTIRPKTNSKNSVSVEAELVTPQPDSGKDSYVPEIVTEFDKIVRLNFPELKAADYVCPPYLYNKLADETQRGKPSISTLQSILASMEEHLAMENHRSVVKLELIKEDKAGYIERRYYSSNKITVGYCDIYTADNYLSILAHELSHAYQFYRYEDNVIDDEQKREEFTDALTFYLGFGKFTIRGKTARHTRYVGDSRYETQTVTLGYLDEATFPYFVRAADDFQIEQEKRAKEKENNRKMINKMDSVFETISFYLSNIDGLLSQMQAKNIGTDELAEIEDIILTFDSKYLERIKLQVGDYHNASLEENKKKLIFLQDKASETMAASYYLSTIIRS